MSDRNEEKRPLLKPPSRNHKRFVLVIHGGAGTMSREKSTPSQREAYKRMLKAALEAGHSVLKGGGEAMDAAVAAVTVMEDCPLFNCAKGAVFNTGGKNELEASVMLSKPPQSHPTIPSNRAGFGLTLLTKTKNPSHAARALYLSPSAAPHVFLSGSEAERLASEITSERLVDPSYFFTKDRWIEHRRGLGLPEDLPPDRKPADGEVAVPLDILPTGTVGAVALDQNGCIASVTSTGGRTNKLVGRIGDTPHMGSGFWAEEWKVRGTLQRMYRRLRGHSATRAVGVSGTGDGDYFIRRNAAAAIADRMKLLGEPLSRATNFVVNDLAEHEGIGGVIALDEQGNYSLGLNSSGMYRGVILEDGKSKTAIFSDEELS